MIAFFSRNLCKETRIANILDMLKVITWRFFYFPLIKIKNILLSVPTGYEKPA